MRTIRLILGDQLNPKHSWFGKPDSDVRYVMAELRQETGYVLHHIQKVAGFFTAMRNFALWLDEKGHRVNYYRITDPDNPQQLDALIARAIKTHRAEKFEYLLPDEYRLDVQLQHIAETCGIETSAHDTEHFFTTRDELAEFFKGKKSFLMESFYRHMRQKHDILMDGKNPRGGKWNYDHSNRHPLKKDVEVPDAKLLGNDVSAVMADIRIAGIETFGSIDEKVFDWPVTRAQSLDVLRHFCLHLLQHFGDYQDAMHTGEKFLFHSRLSFAMNTKMISPKEVVQTVLNYFGKHASDVKLQEVEGFVRQILGWREYVRGMYWTRMPGFADENVLNHKRKLPGFFWDAETGMSCLRESIGQSLSEAYAHHIQRLMVIGNFALLAGLDPDKVDAWYLGVYIDAVEWVEMPNTRGMSQWADGGLIATKPYISAGNYINKMSDYCNTCRYDVKKKIGDDACPFNSLYWNFLDRHRKTFADNPRMTMMYALLDKMKPTERAAIIAYGEKLLSAIDTL